MCGIAGVFCFADVAPSGDVLRRMSARLAHRGPDDEGIEIGSGWGLAHRRLAILGLATGHQPMANEDGGVRVAFNGEIYNYVELRRELTAAGHVFRTGADTEVLVHGYEAYGATGLLERLQGMFAFALVDTRGERRLVLARDRLGQKPLYVYSGRDRYAFASELHALLACPDVPREIDLQALHDYLSFLYVPAPSTIYRDVLKLPPGAFLTVSANGVAAAPQTYWRPCFAPKRRISRAEAVAGTRARLEAAVVKRLQSEVPLGAFLSGGIDSTAIVGLMQRHTDTPVRSFTIGFADPRYDERRYAQIAADHLGTDHHCRVSAPGDATLLRELIRHHGEPYCDASMLPTALLSRFTREHVTVALSGDGGDELFGGYQRYQVMGLERWLRPVPAGLRAAIGNGLLRLLPERRESRTCLSTVRRLLDVYSHGGVAAYARIQTVFSEAMKAAVYARQGARKNSLCYFEQLLAQATASDAMDRYMELDLLSYLPGDILPKVDIASMACGLETRSPFLDHELVDFVTRLPRAFKMTLTTRKRLLLDAAADLLPPEIRRRGKLGFGVPVTPWLRGEWRPLLEEMRQETAWNIGGLFDLSVVGRLIDEHVAGGCDHGAALWSLLCWRLWVEEVHLSD